MAKFGDGGDLLKCSFCGKSQKQVKKDIDRDKILTAQEALEYGLVDNVISNRKKTQLTAVK